MITIAALAAFAALQGGQLPIYRAGVSLKDQGIFLYNWGSGLAKGTDEIAYEGSESVRMLSRNYFQGGVMSFANPVDLSSRFDNKNDLLRIVFHVTDNSTVIGNAPGGRGSNPDSGGGRGGGGGLVLFTPDNYYGPTPGFAIGFQRGGRGGGGGEDAGGGSAQPGGAQGRPTLPGAVSAPPFSVMRLIVTTTDGLKSEAYLPAGVANPKDRGWREISIPLSGISGLSRTNKVVKALGFSVDRLATFYIGDIRMISDTTPIHGDLNIEDNINVPVDSIVTFKANGDGGSTILRIVWDFDETDGIQEDAEGWEVKRAFRKPGTYVVTCSFTDKYGLKSPLVKKIKIKVNP